jgi:hypothetical protein
MRLAVARMRRRLGGFAASVSGSIEQWIASASLSGRPVPGALSL